MKHKKTAKDRQGLSDYRQLRIRLFSQVTLMTLLAAVVVEILYREVLHNRFANWVVATLQSLFGMEYEAARRFYWDNIRAHYDFVFLLAIGIVFFLIFSFFSRRFADYFLQINRGLDSLVEERPEDIQLARELLPTERKLNQIKHTLSARAMEARLAEQRKNELVVYLAHDLKTPLTSVIGYLTLLRDEAEISPALREKYLSIALDKSRRLEELVEDFFDITRFNLSEIALCYSQVDLSLLLEQLASEFQPMLAEKSLTCTLERPPRLALCCDGDKLQRVLDNLLRNAVVYCFPQSDIAISAWEAEGQAHIRFVNQGPPIPQETLDRMFEQFFRGDAARSSRSGGAGLGLAIAKQIVELHGGTISARSQGETVTFSVSLPLAPAGSQPPSP